MKRLYLVLTILLSSFLLFSGKEVKASTYDYTIPESVINFNVENITTIIDIVESFLQNDNTYYDYYIIAYQPGGNIFAYLSTVSDVSFVEFYYYNGARVRVQSKFARYNVSLNNLSLYEYTSPSVTNNFITSIFVNYYILYSNFNIALLNNGNIYNYSFLENTYQDISDGQHSFTTVNDMCNMYYGSPEPEDPTPVLTSFYSLCIQKISYFCEYMATNTLFLTMLVVIILIFIFELIFRRRL